MESLCRMYSSCFNFRISLQFNKFHQLRWKSRMPKDAEYIKIAKHHEYKNLFPWKARVDLANYLNETIVYNEDGLIVINKPYGVAVRPFVVPEGSNKKMITETLSASNVIDCPITIFETLPYLADLLKVKQLHIMKSPERYTSGLMVLTSTKKAAERITKAVLRVQSLGVLQYSYWAVTSGIPLNYHEAKRKVGITLVEVPEHDQKVAVIELKPSKNAAKRQILKPVSIEYEVLDTNHHLNSALLQISASAIKWHFVRVYLAHKLAPVLGDSLYSTRVKSVLGKTTTISPFNKACYDPPKLSISLCNRLQIPPSAVPSIPTHLHLHKLTLSKYNNGEDLVLQCLPFRHFLWTCKQLDLSPDAQSERERLVAA